MKSDNLPQAFAKGKTPEAWCDILKHLHGIKVSARTVRTIARETGQYRRFGRQMLLLPHHVDEIAAHLTAMEIPKGE
ncbi:MAG: hypothetical protein AAFU41_09575 [Pseudomonadota bacterium]